jgi:hypothetical protein
MDCDTCLTNHNSMLDKLGGWPFLASLILKSNISRERKIRWLIPLAKYENNSSGSGENLETNVGERVKNAQETDAFFLTVTSY